MAIQLVIRESGLFYYICSNKLCLSSKSNVLFPLRLLLVLLICVSQGKT